MLLNSRKFFRLAVDRYSVERTFVHHIEQIGKPDNVIEVCMRQKDIKRLGLQMVANPIHGRSGIEYHTDFWQHQASGLSRFTRMIAAGTEEEYTHKG